MALQVWLPLNGNLNNQGLRKITVTNNGAVIDNNGKIGKCYTYTTAQNMEITNLDFSSLSSCSISFWLKVTTKGNSGWLPFAGQSTLYYILATSGGTGAFYHHNAGNGQKIYKDGILSTTPGALNEWHHYCITGLNLSAWTKFYINKYNSNWNFAGSINDIRIYDHALSPKEVKEISKGLVLHYTLDDYSRNTLLPPGVELYDYIQSDGTLWIDTKYVPNDTSGIYLRAYCTTSGGNHLAIGCRQTSGNTRWWINYSNTLELSWNLWTGTLTGYTNTWTEVEHNYMNSRSAKVNGTTYSVSYPTLANITYSAYLFNSCNQGNLGTGFIGRISNAKITEGTSIVRNYLPCTYLGEPGMWDTVENKFYRNQGTGQFILGNKITTTYNDNIIYDCSGYLNNSIVTGNLTIVSDSSRYSMATCFNGSSYINRISLDSSSEVKTISFWANWSSVDFSLNYASQCVLFVDNGTKTGFGLLSNKLILLTTSVAGESYTYPNQNFIANVWYHFVIVITGATTRDLYINGVKKTPTSSKNKWTYSVNQLQIGRRSTTSDGFNGKISDFRMYATTLLDEDIKELYDTSTIIDNLNNLHTRELIEDNMDYVEISKKGIVKTDSLTEGNNGIIFSSDNIECNQLIEI